MVGTIPHILMTAHGTMPGGEIWSCGLRSYWTPTNLSPESGQTLANNVAERWGVFRDTASSGSLLFGQGVTNSAHVVGCTVRELNNFGVTISQYEGSPTTPELTGASPAFAPNQSALCVTLITARAGRTGKGRFYLPCLKLGSDTLNSQVSTTALTAITASVKTLLDGINVDLAAAFGGPLRIAVQSPKASEVLLGDPVNPDYHGADVIAFKIGSVIDTQRRRRASLNETYSTAALA